MYPPSLSRWAAERSLFLVSMIVERTQENSVCAYANLCVRAKLFLRQSIFDHEEERQEPFGRESVPQWLKQFHREISRRKNTPRIQEKLVRTETNQAVSWSLPVCTVVFLEVLYRILYIGCGIYFGRLGWSSFEKSAFKLASKQCMRSEVVRHVARAIVFVLIDIFFYWKSAYKSKLPMYVP